MKKVHWTKQMEKGTLYKTGLHGRGKTKSHHTDKNNEKYMKKVHWTKHFYMDEERLSYITLRRA
jgi:hypothetical protein